MATIKEIYNELKMIMEDVDEYVEVVDVLPDDDQEDAEDIDVDSSGRILISKPLREYASLVKKIILIGQGDKFEIWDQNLWNQNVDKWRDEVTSNDDAEALSDISI